MKRKSIHTIPSDQIENYLQGKLSNKNLTDKYTAPDWCALSAEVFDKELGCLPVLQLKNNERDGSDGENFCANCFYYSFDK